MNYQRLVGILGEFSDAFAPVGCEKVMRDKVTAHLDSAKIGHFTDKTGNLVVEIKGKSSEKRILYSSFLDEPGFIAERVEEDGQVRFAVFGGMPTQYMSGRLCVLSDGKDSIDGVISAKPIHLLEGGERDEPIKADRLYVETGVSKKDELPAFVGIGCFGVLKSRFSEFGDGFFKGKALDGRAGAAVLLCTLLDASEEGIVPEFDSFFVFCVRGKAGPSGAAPCATALKPDLCFSFSGSEAVDSTEYPEHMKNCAVRNGVVLSYSDNAVIGSREAVDGVVGICKGNDIPYQFRRTPNGPGDGGINKSGAGVRSVSIAFPVKYMNSANNLLHGSDLLSVYKLTAKLFSEAVM